MSEAGAVQVTRAEVVPLFVATTPDGASGAPTVTATGLLTGPDPCWFRAVMRKVYVFPGDKPETVRVLAGPKVIVGWATAPR